MTKKKLSHDLGTMHWQSWHSTRQKDFMKEKSPIRRTKRADKILKTDRILGYNCKVDGTNGNKFGVSDYSEPSLVNPSFHSLLFISKRME